MLRNLSLISIILLLCASVQAQSKFNRLYDNKGTGDRANAVIADNEDNYVMAGITNGGNKVLVIKTDNKGDTLWTLSYQVDIGPNGNFAFTITQLDTNTYLVGGSAAIASQGHSDAFITRISREGKILNTKTYGNTTHSERCCAIKVLPDKRLVFAGLRYIPTGADVYIVGTDNAGVQQWERQYGGTKDDFIESMDFTHSGGYILAGTTYSYGQGQYNMYLVKTDSIGDSIWQKTYGGPLTDYGTCVITTKDGGYVLVGATEIQTDIKEAYVVKTDSNGKQLWARSYTSKYQSSEFNAVKEFLMETY